MWVWEEANSDPLVDKQMCGQTITRTYVSRIYVSMSIYSLTHFPGKKQTEIASAPVSAVSLSFYLFCSFVQLGYRTVEHIFGNRPIQIIKTHLYSRKVTLCKWRPMICQEKKTNTRCYNEALWQRRDYKRELKAKRQSKSLIPKWTKKETPQRRQPWD